jgi:hypothetical protein
LKNPKYNILITESFLDCIPISISPDVSIADTAPCFLNNGCPLPTRNFCLYDRELWEKYNRLTSVFCEICFIEQHRVFQKSLYNFESLYTFIQRTWAVFWTVIM